MALIKCRACNSDVSDSADFCVHCGVKLTGRAAGQNDGVPDPARDFDELDGITIEELSLFGYYIKCFKKFLVFSGRARRKEFWGFLLFFFIFLMAAKLMDTFLLGYDPEENGFLYQLYRLIWLIPGLAVIWRRLHDAGHSGFYFLLVFLPLVGWVFMLIALCSDGDGGDNQYGDNPKFPDSMFKMEES